MSVLHRIARLLAIVVLASACASASEPITSTAPPPPSTSTSTTSPSTTTTTVAPATTAPTTTTTTLPEVSVDNTASYHVGNSLTLDTLGFLIDGHTSISILAHQADRGLDPVGYHINCGASLDTTIDNPRQICVDPIEPFGYFDEALPGFDWDVVTVQPYPGSTSTLGSDQAAITEIVGLADRPGEDGAAQIYVLTGWPGRDNYATEWSASSDDVDDTPTTISRAYFENLVARLRPASDADVFLIPVGDVLLALDERFGEGDIIGYSGVEDLYRDETHLNTRGQWIAGATTLTVILGIDPDDLGKPRNPWYGPPDGFSRELIDAAHDTIRDVVLNDPLSGRTGFDS